MESMANQIEWLLGGLGVMCYVIWFIIAILIMIWVYRDAESRGMSGVLWLVIVFFLGIIGLIIYLVVRKPKVAVAPPVAYGAPPGYGAPPPGYGAPPPAYGAPPPAYAQPPPPQQQPMGTNCRYCGAPVPPGSMVCPRCGGRL